MDNHDTDKLLEQGLFGDPPGKAFRARVLEDSAAAFIRARGSRARWRHAALSAAAVFVAGMSFLLGRWSLGPLSPPQPPPVVAAGETVAVPHELIAWLEAAQLFRQLGMEDRMARAVERACRLVPADAVAPDGQTLRPFVAESIENGEERVPPMGMPGPNPSVQRLDQILAQAFGD